MQKFYSYVNKGARTSFSNYWGGSDQQDEGRLGKFYSFFFSNSYSASRKLYNTTTSNYNIYFLRKESYYTKLKYSRVPQFDTSSNAVAALLSGFYGYLVCEKFGFELIDSGDFLFIALYLVLFSLIVVAILKIVEGNFNLSTFVYSFFRSFI